MRSRHLVHRELLDGLTLWSDKDMDLERLKEARNQAIPAPPAKDLPDVVTRQAVIPGPPGAPDVLVRIHRDITRASALPAVLHIHGGGYVRGTPESSDNDNRILAHSLGCVVASVAYRLAPETAFPGPLEDCYAALKWLHGSAHELGIDPSRIAVKGESAGGGLAAGLALLARDRGEFPIMLQVLIYPMIDDRPPATPHPFTGEFVWTRGSNWFGWSCYLGCEPGLDGISPYAAPARAVDLGNLPATFVATGALDLFLEEDLDYARRLTRAGVPTELHVYPGSYHGFPLVGDTTLARRFNADVQAALLDAFAS